MVSASNESFIHVMPDCRLMMSLQEKYTSELSDYLDGHYIELFWKGRVGLYALLKTFGVGAGDEVVMPAFTCVVVPSAVIYLGAKPVFVDIEARSYSATSKAIANAVTENTKVIICQNTFGLSVEIEEIVSFANMKGIYTIEDCTHGFGGKYSRRPNGTYCDAAIYSTQWNKPFSTGVGGFITAEKPELIDKLAEVTQHAVKPGFMEQVQLFILYLLKKILVNRYTYWTILKFYRLLSKKGIVVGSSSPEELEGTNQPEDYFKKSGLVQAILGRKALRNLEGTLVKRRENAEIYTNALKELGKNHVALNFFDNHSFLVYPLLVKDKVEFADLAENNQIMLGDWFASPLHPITDSLERWGLNIEEFPVARYCSKHIVNLPTNINDPSAVVSFLKSQSGQLIDG